MPDEFLSGAVPQKKVELNLIGSRLSGLCDALQEIENKIASSANTLFGQEDESEAQPKDERLPTIVNLIERLESHVRAIVYQTNRF